MSLKVVYRRPTKKRVRRATVQELERDLAMLERLAQKAHDRWWWATSAGRKPGDGVAYRKMEYIDQQVRDLRQKLGLTP
jgi:hypothetical protein